MNTKFVVAKLSPPPQVCTRHQATTDRSISTRPEQKNGTESNIDVLQANESTYFFRRQSGSSNGSLRNLTRPVTPMSNCADEFQQSTTAFQVISRESNQDLQTITNVQSCQIGSHKEAEFSPMQSNNLNEDIDQSPLSEQNHCIDHDDRPEKGTMTLDGVQLQSLHQQKLQDRKYCSEHSYDGSDILFSSTRRSNENLVQLQVDKQESKNEMHSTCTLEHVFAVNLQQQEFQSVMWRKYRAALLCNIFADPKTGTLSLNYIESISLNMNFSEIVDRIVDNALQYNSTDLKPNRDHDQPSISVAAQQRQKSSVTYDCDESEINQGPPKKEIPAEEHQLSCNTSHSDTDQNSPKVKWTSSPHGKKASAFIIDMSSRLQTKSVNEQPSEKLTRPVQNRLYPHQHHDSGNEQQIDLRKIENKQHHQPKQRWIAKKLRRRESEIALARQTHSPTAMTCDFHRSSDEDDRDVVCMQQYHHSVDVSSRDTKYPNSSHTTYKASPNCLPKQVSKQARIMQLQRPVRPSSYTLQRDHVVARQNIRPKSEYSQLHTNETKFIENYSSRNVLSKDDMLDSEREVQQSTFNLPISEWPSHMTTEEDCSAEHKLYFHSVDRRDKGIEETEDMSKRQTKPTKLRSNIIICKNAVQSPACLGSGEINADQRNEALAAIDASSIPHLVIVLRTQNHLKFRGIYAVVDEKITRIYGAGPRTITKDMVTKYFRYDSGSKAFKPLPSRDFSVCDAVALLPSCWKKKDSRAII